MHILIIPSDHFQTARAPLSGIFQLHQATALNAAGHQVGILSPGVISVRYFLRRYPYLKTELSHGYPIHRSYVRKLFPQRWISPQSGIAMYQDIGLALYQQYVARHGKPDLIHAHDIKYAGFVAQSIKALDNIPYIITEHSSVWLEESISHWITPAKAAVQNAAVMTAVSAVLGESIRKQLDIASFEVLPNLVDDHFMPDSLNKQRHSEFVFLNVASLDANKNQSLLIKAFAQHFRGKSVALHIGGTGPFERRLKRLAKKLGVSHQIVFLGYLNRTLLAHAMQKADCFVLSSFMETFGVVLIEALKCGIPVVATRCGGPNEIVTEKNGLLVDVDDVSDMGQAMVKMFERGACYSPEDLREDCMSRFGAKIFVERTLKLYERVMAGDNLACVE